MLCRHCAEGEIPVLVRLQRDKISVLFSICFSAGTKAHTYVPVKAYQLMRQAHGVTSDAFIFGKLSYFSDQHCQACQLGHHVVPASTPFLPLLIRGRCDTQPLRTVEHRERVCFQRLLPLIEYLCQGIDKRVRDRKRTA